MPTSKISDVWHLAGQLTPTMVSCQDNSVFSPVSLHAFLSVMRFGAAGKTAQEIDTLIGGCHLTAKDYGLIPQIPGGYGPYAARIATGVWLDTSAQPTNEFIRRCSNEGILLERTNLSDPKTCTSISQWIADVTEGLLSPSVSIPSHAMAFVSNALYFRDAWDRTFRQEDTYHGLFHTNRSDTMTEFMICRDWLAMLDCQFGSLIFVPFSNGARMAFLLPHEGISLEGILNNADALHAISSKPSHSAALELHIPKFICEYSDTMTSHFIHAGFETAKAPNVLLMTGSQESVAAYSHSTKLIVNERGIEAGSCTTSMYMGTPDTLLRDTPVITLNRPFIFAVISSTDHPLFIGSVVNPGSGPEPRTTWSRCAYDYEKGPEGGFVVRSEQLPDVGSILMEQDAQRAPYSVTCTVPDYMTHTTWADDYGTAGMMYDGMKRGLAKLAQERTKEGFDEASWLERFTRHQNSFR